MNKVTAPVVKLSTAKGRKKKRPIFAEDERFNHVPILPGAFED